MSLQVRHFGALVGGKLTRIPFALVSMFLLARLLGPIGVGQWAMLLSIATLLHTVLLGWTQGANVRFGREEWVLQNGLSQTWATRIPVVTLGILVATFLLIWQPFSFVNRYYGLSSDWWPLLLLHFLGLWLLAETQSLFRITGKIIQLAAVPVGVDFLVILFLVFLFLFQHSVEVIWVMSGMVVIPAIVWGGWWIFESHHVGSWREGIPWACTGSMQIIKYGWPLVPGLFFAYFSNWGDHIILQHFRSSAEIGLFDAGYQVMVALTGIASPIAILLLPKLIDRKHCDPHVEHDHLVRIVPTIATLWIMLTIFGLTIIPWLFLAVFGVAFQPALPLLLILCSVVPGAGILALYAVLFELQGRLHRATWYAAIMCIVNIIISYNLVPKLGGVGAAIGTLTSYYTIQFLYVTDQHEYCGVPRRKIYIILLLNVVCGLLQYFAGEELTVRIMVACLELIGVTFLARSYYLIDREILKGLFQGKWPFFCNNIVRLLTQKNKEYFVE